MAEPSDSILSSPKQSISELLASETSDVVDEFLPTEGWFGADINDEISNDLYSEVHIDIKPDKETKNSSKRKNNRKRPVCSQDNLSASDYKIDSTVNKKKQKDLHLDRKCTGSVTNVGNCLTSNYNTTNM